MTRVDLRAALDMLPRMNPSYGKRLDKYCTWGSLAVINFDKLADNIDKLLHKIIIQIDDSDFTHSIERVDVTGKNIFILHRCIKVRHLKWLYRQSWRWQKWKESKLPIYLRYNGKLVVWDGTHRTTLGRLAQRKVRARVLDINKFIKYKKAHPEQFKRVVKVKPKKKGKRK